LTEFELRRHDLVSVVSSNNVRTWICIHSCQGTRHKSIHCEKNWTHRIHQYRRCKEPYICIRTGKFWSHRMTPSGSVIMGKWRPCKPSNQYSSRCFLHKLTYDLGTVVFFYSYPAFCRRSFSIAACVSQPRTRRRSTVPVPV
jgi:hypothetical protein